MTTLLVAMLALAGCAADSVYDPDWEAAAPIDGGKADGLLDILPVLSFDGELRGDVGDNRSELYVIQLQRTDRIELSMTVTSGDLNPHLSFFYGTSSYVGSESWDRDGDTLKKVYVAEEAGKYLVAARAYHGEGAGEYTVSARCVGGPCAGEFPPPGSEYNAQTATECIAKARRCAFDRMPAFDGAIGEVRARQIFEGCLEGVSLDDGSSCARACAYTGEEGIEYDDDNAMRFCNGIQEMLIFYADQSPACVATLDSCIGECYDAFEYGYGPGDEHDFYYTPENLCLDGGFNGNCDSYARRTADCGGNLPRDGAAQCTELCESTTGAHIDDLDTICGYDSDCDSYCDVDFAAAEAECGAWAADNVSCFETWMDDHDSWVCEDELRNGTLDP